MQTIQNALHLRRKVEYPGLEEALQVVENALEATEKAKRFAQAQAQAQPQAYAALDDAAPAF